MESCFKDEAISGACGVCKPTNILLQVVEYIEEG